MRKAQIVDLMCNLTVCCDDGHQLFTQVYEMNEHAVSAGHAILMEH